MPIETEHASERLKPERVAQPAKQFLRTFVTDDERADGPGHFHHAAKEPGGSGSGMERKISGSLRRHVSIHAAGDVL